MVTWWEGQKEDHKQDRVSAGLSRDLSLDVSGAPRVASSSLDFTLYAACQAPFAARSQSVAQVLYGVSTRTLGLRHGTALEYKVE